jgi:hypothetical protein
LPFPADQAELLDELSTEISEIVNYRGNAAPALYGVM